MTTLINNLAYLLKALDITQLELKSATGIKQSTFSNWLNGQGEPRASDLVLLSQYFGVSIDILVTVDIEKGNLIEKIIENFGRGKGNLIGYPSGNLNEKKGNLFPVSGQLEPAKKANEETTLWMLLQEQKRNSEKLDRALLLLEDKGTKQRKETKGNP